MCFSSAYLLVITLNLDFVSILDGSMHDPAELIVCLTQDDEVGAFRIPAQRVSEMMRAALGTESSDTFQLSLGGKLVVGHDKALSKVVVKIRVSEVPVVFPSIVAEAGSSGPKRLEVTVFSARSLPKMDSLLGSCDPYALVTFQNVCLCFVCGYVCAYEPFHHHHHHIFLFSPSSLS